MEDNWQSKEIDLEGAVKKIPDGSHVYIGNAAATAHTIVTAMATGVYPLVDIEFIQFLPGGPLPHLLETAQIFRTNAFFAYCSTAGQVQKGVADYTPISYSGISRLIQERKITVDVAIIKVTPPDENGFCSLGIGVDITHEMLKNAAVVIAEVTRHMPWTEGDSRVHTRDIDWWVASHQPMMTDEALFPLWCRTHDEDLLAQVGRQVLTEIPDGATLKLDLTPAASAVLPFLCGRRDIGLHTDLMTDQLAHLIRNGTINNSRKNVHHGKTIVSHACGSQHLYQFVNRNPDIEFHPWSYVNQVDLLRRHENLVSIIGGFKVDMSGQVALDSVGHRIFGGLGSASHSIQGAARSRGGKPIIALPSISMKGNSNIVFSLPQGSGVAVPRADTHYIVTEYGTAYLYGKTIRERCLSLIEIAHPKFRDQLIREAKANHYIHAQQPGHSFKSGYPKQWESTYTSKIGKRILVRPIKAVDEDRLRDFFHKLSDTNIYMRYFTHLRSLPQKVLQQSADIDYSQNMTLVALSPPDNAYHEIIGIGQWVLDLHDRIPEIAFQIRDDWQGEGLGKYLFHRLAEMAGSYGISQFKAEVMVENKAMNHLFEKSPIVYQRRVELGIYSYLFQLQLDASTKRGTQEAIAEQTPWALRPEIQSCFPTLSGQRKSPPGSPHGLSS